MTEQQPLAYTRSQAAKAVGVSPEAIKRAVRSGDLPAYYPQIDGKPLRSYLIRREDLEAWAFPTK